MMVYLFFAGISIYLLVVYYLCLTSEMPDLMDVEEEVNAACFFSE